LTDSELDTVFKPLIDLVEEKTHIIVERSLDEFRAEMEDRAQDNEMDDLLTTKKADILEKVLVSENGGTPEIKSYIGKLKSTANILITRTRPTLTCEITEDELYEYPKDDPYWSKYLKKINISIPDPKLYALYKAYSSDVVNTCIRHDITYDALCKYIDELIEAGAISSFDSRGMILTARDLRRARRAVRAQATKPY
jgi:hypothetical protein